MKSMLVCLSVLLIVFSLAGCGGGGGDGNSSSGGNIGGPGSGNNPSDSTKDMITINGTAHKGVGIIIKDGLGNSVGSTAADAATGAYSVKINPFKDPNSTVKVYFSDSATPVNVVVNNGQTYTVNEP